MQSWGQLDSRNVRQRQLDGARLFNAAVALVQETGQSPIQQAKEICRYFDSASVCLSKGLGAPIGSLLLGPKSFIAQAKRVRKILGGAMRQSGLLAAAGIYALKNNVARLADDHANADVLADGLIRVVAANSTLAGQVVVHPALTNMVFMDIPTTMVDTFVEYLAGKNVKIKADRKSTRLNSSH